MARRIVIDPVTRIEGHAKITIQLDEASRVREARFHVTEFRGFERMFEGRPLWEMPGITARICGICPVSHLVASSKAGDEILAVPIPPAADALRRLANLAQIIQSHALSFFHLSAPDLLLGMDSDPQQRNLFGLMAAEPEVARRGIRLRQFGQEIIARLGGQKIHPSWSVPGGVRGALNADDLAWIRDQIPATRDGLLDALDRFQQIAARHPQEIESFGNFPSLFLGLVAPDGSWEHYQGRLRIVDHQRRIVADQVEPNRFEELLGEASQRWSYLKSPYYRPLGYPDGIYRVGPLARLNLCDRFGTPLADQQLDQFRQLAAGAVTSSFYYHLARLIEMLAATELIERMLDDPRLTSSQLRASAGINRLEGIGCSEAPRGTLFHHYRVDQHGVIRAVNLLIATGQNNLAMNETVAQIARRWITGPEIPEGVLNRLEAGIRAFDPCLSCSTHAAGQMPLAVQLIAPDGRVVAERTRP